MAGSWRKQPLPPGWSRIRAAVLARDGHRCQWRIGNTVCGAYAGEVDHIDENGPQDDKANLRSLCSRHHKARSSGQGGAAWAAVRKRMAAAKTREPERHPGLR